MAASSLAIDVVSRRNRPVRTGTVKICSMGSAPRQLWIRASLWSCPQPLQPVREMAWTGPAGWLSMTLPQAARRARREALTSGMTAPVLRKSAAGQTAREGSRSPRRGQGSRPGPLGRTRNTNAAPIRFPASTRRPYLGPADRPIGPGKRPTRTVLSRRAMAAHPDEAPRFLSSKRPQSHQGRSSDVRENRWLTCPERGPVTRRRVVADSPLDFRSPSKATGRCCGPFAFLRRQRRSRRCRAETPIAR